MRKLEAKLGLLGLCLIVNKVGIIASSIWCVGEFLLYLVKDKEFGVANF